MTASKHIDRAPKQMSTLRNWATCAYPGCNEANVKGMTRNPRCAFHSEHARRVSKPRLNYEQPCVTCTYFERCREYIFQKWYIPPCSPESGDFAEFIATHDPAVAEADALRHMANRGASTEQLSQHFSLSRERVAALVEMSLD